MGERKHTPWRVLEPAAHWTNPNMGLWEVETADGINVCSHLTRDDAFRVAALPDLPEALRALTAQCEAEFTLDGVWVNAGQLVKRSTYQKARAAIAKAEGQ